MKELVKKGTFGFGVFECTDLNATYEELNTKGVVFNKPTTKEFYGYEALFVDDSGNWFSLGQKNYHDMEQKIQLKHPEGKKAVSISKAKYDVLKKAFLNYLKKKGGSTHTEILHEVADDFKINNIKFEGSIQWHMEWVKLDLEANKIIERVKGTSPEKYVITK